MENINIKARNIPYRDNWDNPDLIHFIVDIFRDNEHVMTTPFSVDPAHPFIWAEMGADGDKEAQRAWEALIYKNPFQKRIPLHDEPLRKKIVERYKALAPLTVNQVMEGLLMAATGSDQPFEDWCREFGYSPDSRRAHREWEECNETRRKLELAFGSLEYLHREYYE